MLCQAESWLEELCEELSNVLRMYKVLKNVSKQLWEYASKKKGWKWSKEKQRYSKLKYGRLKSHSLKQQ